MAFIAHCTDGSASLLSRSLNEQVKFSLADDVQCLFEFGFKLSFPPGVGRNFIRPGEGEYECRGLGMTVWYKWMEVAEI